MTRTVILCFCSVVLAISCSSEPTLDGSSKEAWKQSVEEVRASLTAEELALFNKSVTYLVVFGPAVLHAFEVEVENPRSLTSDEAKDVSAAIDVGMRETYRKYDGMTAKEVIEICKEIQVRLEKE
jgi:uncharacterized protein DUF6694